MHSIPARLYVDLIGCPFVEGGRGPDAFDCVGLAAELQRRLGRSLRSFVSNEDELHRQIAAGGVLHPCRRLASPEVGSVVFVKMAIGEHHIGTMVDQFRMLHTTSQTGGAVVEAIIGPLWSRRIQGFYTMEDRS